jgi:hypothetical protein
MNAALGVFLPPPGLARIVEDGLKMTRLARLANGYCWADKQKHYRFGPNIIWELQ